MNHDEIRDQLTGLQARADMYQYLGQYKEAEYLGDACGLIETLLAREAEALKDLKNRHTLSRDDNVNVALWNALDAARAILNPQPAALAKENDNE